MLGHGVRFFVKSRSGMSVYCIVYFIATSLNAFDTATLELRYTYTCQGFDREGRHILIKISFILR